MYDNTQKMNEYLTHKIYLRDCIINDLLHMIDNNLINNTGRIPLKAKILNMYTKINNSKVKEYFLSECKYTPIKN